MTGIIRTRDTSAAAPAVSIAGAALIAVGALTASPATADNHDEHDKHAMSAFSVRQGLRFLDEMPTQTQKMSVHVLLIALDVDGDEQMDALRDSRAEFIEAFNAMRYGSEEAGIPLIADVRELETAILTLDVAWPQFDAVVGSALSGSVVDDDAVATIASLNDELYELAHEAVEAFAEHMVRGTSSILLPITEAAEHQTLVVQRMMKNYLLIAHQHDVRASRATLGADMAEFETALLGLISGNAERGLLPAMTPEIRVQLNEVTGAWGQLKPHFDGVVQGRSLNFGSIGDVAQLADRLYEEMEAAATMYSRL